MLVVGAGVYLILGSVTEYWLLLVGTMLAFVFGWGWDGLMVYLVVSLNQHRPAEASGVSQTGVFAGGVVGPARVRAPRQQLLIQRGLVRGHRFRPGRRRAGPTGKDDFIRPAYAALTHVRKIRDRPGWYPDVIHATAVRSSMQPPVDIADREDYKQRMRDWLEIDPARTVALTVDMQREYLDASVGTSPVVPEVAASVIAGSTKLLDYCRSVGVPVVHAYVKRRRQEAERRFYSHPYGRASRQLHLSQNPNAEARDEVDRIEGGLAYRVPDELVGADDVHMTTKRPMDSFHRSDLDVILGEVLKPDTLLIMGINTDTCVYATTFAAASRNYQPIVISDCVGSMRGQDHHWMALELMSRTMAWTMTYEEAVAKMNAHRS